MPAEAPKVAPLRGWRSWCVAAFMWLACRFVPRGYAIKFDLMEDAAHDE